MQGRRLVPAGAPALPFPVRAPVRALFWPKKTPMAEPFARVFFKLSQLKQVHREASCIALGRSMARIMQKTREKRHPPGDLTTGNH